MFIWEFDRSLDTPKSFAGFCFYRNLGLNRSLQAAYAACKGRSEGVKRAAGYFERWACSGNWQSRAEAFDLHQESVEREILAKTNEDHYLSQLAQFRVLQIEIGRDAVLTLREIRQKVSDFIADMDPIATLDDCEQLCRISKSLDGGSEMWGTGLCVNELINNMKAEK